MALTFQACQAGYANIWSAARVRPEWEKEAKSVAAAIFAGKARLGQFKGIPYWFVGGVNHMESGVLFKGHLFNGDSLSGYTRQVPAGMPNDVDHGPPFTWDESAASALRHDGIDKVTGWSIERALFMWEVHYNGMGYFAKGVNSPYDWSGTTAYGDPPNLGFYVAAHVFDRGARSKQCGCAAVLKELILLDPSISSSVPPVKTDPAVSHDQFHDVLGTIFGKVVPGTDSRKQIAQGLSLVGGMNELFGSQATDPGNVWDGFKKLFGG